jgi:N-terminal domain of toast_rack, DUF2154
MKKRFLGIAIMLFGVLLLAGCGFGLKVGALQTESQSVELENENPVSVEITLGTGDLQVAGGAEKLMDADFSYNVAELKPEVTYKPGALVVRQPEVRILPDLRDTADFRNEWRLRLNNRVPMDLSVRVGGGTSDLQLAGLLLTRLDVNVGAGTYTLDLSGDWPRDLEVSIESGAANVSVRLPEGVGARVIVNDGPHTVDATGLTQDGGAYTNAAYGVSDVTLQVNLEAGVGQIYLLVGEEGKAAGEPVTALD